MRWKKARQRFGCEKFSFLFFWLEFLLFSSSSLFSCENRKQIEKKRPQGEWETSKSGCTSRLGQSHAMNAQLPDWLALTTFCCCCCLLHTWKAKHFFDTYLSFFLQKHSTTPVFLRWTSLASDWWRWRLGFTPGDVARHVPRLFQPGQLGRAFVQDLLWHSRDPGRVHPMVHRHDCLCWHLLLRGGDSVGRAQSHGSWTSHRLPSDDRYVRTCMDDSISPESFKSAYLGNPGWVPSYKLSHLLHAVRLYFQNLPLQLESHHDSWVVSQLVIKAFDKR